MADGPNVDVNVILAGIASSNDKADTSSRSVGAAIAQYKDVLNDWMAVTKGARKPVVGKVSARLGETMKKLEEVQREIESAKANAQAYAKTY